MLASNFSPLEQSFVRQSLRNVLLLADFASAVGLALNFFAQDGDLTSRTRHLKDAPHADKRALLLPLLASRDGPPRETGFTSRAAGFIYMRVGR